MNDRRSQVAETSQETSQASASKEKRHAELSQLAAQSAALKAKKTVTLEGSESEEPYFSDSDYEGDREIEETEAGFLLRSLTSEWHSNTENMVLNIITRKADVSERLLKPFLTIDASRHSCNFAMGGTALHFATRLGLIGVVSALMEHRAAIDAETVGGTTPLMMAVLFQRVDIAVTLLSKKASVLLQDENGHSACDLAILEGNPR
ncbi:unnamed protein product, partial [Polarella glacialis]